MFTTNASLSLKIVEEKIMELKGKSTNKTTNNNQNVNSININQGSEKKPNHVQPPSPSSSSDHSQQQQQTDQLNSINETILTNSTSLLPYLNQNSPTAQPAACCLNMNSNHHHNDFNSNNTLVNDLENNPHILNSQVTFSPTSNQFFNPQAGDEENGSDSTPMLLLQQHQIRTTAAATNFESFNSAQSNSCLNKANFTNAITIKETCATCTNLIMDRYLLKVNGHSYHEKCKRFVYAFIAYVYIYLFIFFFLLI